MLKKIIQTFFGIGIIVLVPLVMISLGTILARTHTIRLENRMAFPPSWDYQKIAEKYAPIFYQETSSQEEYKSWDWILPLNFDQDWDLTNNIKNLKDLSKRSLEKVPPVVYYALLETETHFFITYSIFHPAQWELNQRKAIAWFENEMKHLQVVVRKNSIDSEDGRVVMVSIQNSSDSLKSLGQDVEIFCPHGMEIKSQNLSKKPKPFLICSDAEGKMSSKGTHPMIVIQSGGHRLWMLSLRKRSLRQKEKKIYTLKGDGLHYFPNKITRFPGKTKTYQLQSTLRTFWEPKAENSQEVVFFYKKNNFQYTDESFVFSRVPLHFQAGDFVGKTYSLFNSNVTPFAFGFCAARSTSDRFSFFFNPVKAYKKHLTITDWSLKYLYHPYCP